MRARDLAATVVGLALLVFFSSLLGLSARFLFTDPAEAFGFMREIWAASLWADIVFTMGTALGGVVAFLLARRNVVAAIVVGAAAHWIIYVLSFLLLGESETAQAKSEGFGEVVGFVLSWGFPGLILAALAPPLAARSWR